MSYTTGEIAKLCGVSVRTVQYYDSRNILTPSSLSEGGRRLYSKDDLQKMKIICFLREIDLPINSIGKLFNEEDPGSVISILLEQHEFELRKEIEENQKKLRILDDLRHGLQSIENLSVKSIGDVAYVMGSKKKLKKLRMFLLLTGIPVTLLQWGGIILWITTGMWWLFAAWALICIPYVIWISKYYFKRTNYICPHCHSVFKPLPKEAFWASHTTKTRKLTCTNCSHNSFCVEVYDDSADKVKK